MKHQYANRSTKVAAYIVCMAIIIAFLPATAHAAILTGFETNITNIPADQFDPAISGHYVVFTDFSGIDADVWYADLQTGQIHPVNISSGDQQLTDVSDNHIVYTDWTSMDVFVFDITNGETQNVTGDALSNSLDPAISHNLVAWTDDRDGNAEIYAMDLLTGETRRISNDPLVDQSPAVGDGIIVWERADRYSGDVYAYEWATGITTPISTLPYASERLPNVSGRTVVFQSEKGTPICMDIVAVNLDNPGDRQVLHGPDDPDFYTYLCLRSQLMTCLISRQSPRLAWPILMAITAGIS